MNTRFEFDPYFLLVSALHEKEKLESLFKFDVKEKIKAVADILFDPESSDRRFDAAFAYYVAGYYARALNVLPSTSTIPPDAPSAQYFLALFLSKELEDLKTATNIILVDNSLTDEGIRSAYESKTILEKASEDKSLESEVIDRILSRKLAQAFSDFLNFAETGDESYLAKGYDVVNMCERLAIKSHEFQWWWWVSCVRFAMKEFEENSLWSCLRPMCIESDDVSHYIKSNYQHPGPVIELWRSQIQSIESVNDPERKSYCLKMPTGAGKTRVAELMILRFLIDYKDAPETKCVYIAPFRTLAGEVEKTLESSFASILNAKVSQFYGGNEVDPLDQADADQARILVMTPEKLDGLLRQRPDLMSLIRLLIIDEGHLIGDETERGYRYQSLLQRLIYVLKLKRIKDERRGARLLFVSGVLPNANEFAEWLTGNCSNVIESTWRPIDEPTFHDLVWDGNELASFDIRWDGKEILRANKLPISLQRLEPKSQTDFLNEGSKRHQRSFTQIVAHFASLKARMNITMLFSARKKSIDSEPLLSAINEIERTQGLFGPYPLPTQFQRSQYYEKYYRLLELGVAIHHASLPSSLRAVTEERVRESKVQLILASPTLAQGVNLPIQTVLVYGLTRRPGERISDTTFWNVVGRIGRPLPLSPHHKKLVPPEIWFLLDRSKGYQSEDEKYRKELLQRRESFRVNSALLDFFKKIRELWQQTRSGESISTLVSYLAENDLTWIDDTRQREEMQLLLQRIDTFLRDLSREARLALGEVEDCLQTVTRELIRLFQGVEELSQEDLAYIKSAVEARARFLSGKIPEAQRDRDYLLGLPEKDSRSIREHQEELLEWYRASEGIFNGEFEAGLEAFSKILCSISSLSIVNNTLTSDDELPIDQAPKLFDIMDIPGKELVQRKMFRAWVKGDDDAVIDGYLRRISKRIKFEKFKENTLERDIPWGVSALGRYLIDLAGERGQTLPSSLGYLPSLVKYGVPHPLTCWFVRLGLSRPTAKKLFDICMSHEHDQDIAGLAQLSFDDFDWTRDSALVVLNNLTSEDLERLKLSVADKTKLDEILLKSVR